MASKRRKKRGGRPGRQTGLSDLTLEQAWRKYDAVSGRASDSRAISPSEAVQRCTWVYAAITFICEHIMRTPLSIWRGGQRVESHPIEVFMARPNSYDDQDTSAKFRYAYFFELLLNGAVMRLLGGFQGFQPTTMSVRPRWQFAVQDAFDEDGRRVPVSWSLRHRHVSKAYVSGDNIYHDALYNPLHDYEGLAPLTAALMSVGNDIDISEFAHRFFKNDASTGVVFSTDHPSFQQKQAEEAAKKWQDRYSGVEHAFMAKFVGFGLKPHQLGTALDAKVLQALRSLTKEEIVSGIFKVPLDAISAQADGGDIVIGGPSGGTQASSREAFLVNVVMPWCMRYDENFNRDVAWRFPGDVVAEHDFSTNPILERRRLERAKACVELIDRGVPLNEVITWLRLELQPVPWGNDWWIQNDRLPARVVLDAGKDALKIAIPDSGKVTKAQQTYIAEVLALAQQRTVQEGVRHDPLVRVAGNGKGNGSRIADLMIS